MKAPFSDYLSEIAPGLKILVDTLGERYDYVSALSTDSAGFMARVSQHSKEVRGKTMTTERGTVVRVRKDGLYSEYAFDEFDPARAHEEAERAAALLEHQIAVLKACGTGIYETDILEIMRTYRP